jgi:hypothetical protein
MRRNFSPQKTIEKIDKNIPKYEWSWLLKQRKQRKVPNFFCPLGVARVNTKILYLLQPSHTKPLCNHIQLFPVSF